MLNILRVNLPFIVLSLIVWLAIGFYFDLWDSYALHWPIAIVMFCGAFIAGASSEGGGAVAFPALTLLYGLSPAIGSSFSLAIQSFGMTSASYFIVRKKIAICWPMIKVILPFAFLGFLVGKFFIADHLNPKLVKIFFVSFWLSFGIILIFKNRMVKEVYDTISIKTKYEYLLIGSFGIVGGAISAVVGSGIDIVTFSLLVLRFNLSEKVATPTTVVIMAAVSVFGTLVNIVSTGLDPIVLQFLVVAIPVVIFVAPLGSRFISSKNRQFVSRSLVVILIVQYIGALIILNVSAEYFLFSLMVFFSGCLCFYRFGKSNVALRKLKYS